MSRAYLMPGMGETSQVLGTPDYVRALRRAWLGILCAGIAGLSLAAVYVRFFPDTYTSQAIVRFNPPQVADRYVSANDSMQAEQRLFALTQMLTSAVTARKMIESQGLYPELRRFRTVEDLVPQFQANLQVKRVNVAGVDPRRALPSLHMSFRYSSPEKARRVLTLMVESIHEANRGYRGDQSNGTTEFLRMQAESTQERIVELEAQISELGLFDRSEGDHEWALKIQQLYNIENRLGQVQASLRNLNKERADALNDIADFESRLRRVQASVNSKTELPSLELQSLQRRENEAKLAYERILERYRPDYPASVELRIQYEESSRQVREQEARELDTARQRARRDLGNRIDGLKATLATAEKAIQDQQAEEQTLQRRAAQIRNTTKAAPEDNMEYLRLTREYEVLKEFHRGLVKKEQESNVGSEMERLGRGEVIELVEPPTLPTLASQPVWQLKLLLGLVGGFFCAWVVVMWRTVNNPLIRCERHLEMWPSLPLLADIPHALPPASQSPGGFRVRVRWKNSSLLGMLTVLLLAGSGSACSWSRLTAPQYLSQAKAAERSGELRKAMVLYRKALSRDAKLGEAHDALARLELEIGEVDQAYSHLLRATELKPDDFPLHLRLAELTYLVYTAAEGHSQENLLELEAIADKVATRWPGKPEGYIYQALAMQERHRRPKAIELLRSAAAKMGPDPALLTQTAAMLNQQGEGGEAAGILSALVQQGTRYAPAYDLYYLQLMQQRETERAGEVLLTKWRTLGNTDSGLQYAAHLHAMNDDTGLERQLAEVGARAAADPAAPARLGDFWLNRAEPARARKHYEDGWRLFPAERATYVTRLADLDEREGQTAQARARIDKALGETPTDPLLQAHRAAFELQAGSEAARAKAQLELELILQRMPRSSFVRYHLGRAYLRLGDVVKAEQQFERCVRLDPNYAPGWLALAETDVQQGQASRAQTRLERVLVHAPRYPAALLMKAKLQAARGEFAKASQTLDEIQGLGVSEWEIKLRRAELRLLAGAPAEAAALLEQYLKQRPGDTRAVVMMARVEAAQGRTEAALQRLTPVGQAADASEEAAAELAELAMSSGRTDIAVTTYGRLSERFPARVSYRVNYGDALALLGRADEAAAQYQIVQKSAPNDLGAWLHFAALRSSQGRFTDARDAYQKSLAIAPGNPMVQNNYAYVMARTGTQLDYALELAQQADRVLPGNVEIQDTLVYIQTRMGNREQALTAVDRMLARDNGTGRDLLLQVRGQLGKGQLQAAAREMEAARDRAHTPQNGGRS